MNKFDCFASGLNGNCAVTAQKDCAGCKFYKTREQIKQSFLKSKERLKVIGLLKDASARYPLLKEMCRRMK